MVHHWKCWQQFWWHYHWQYCSHSHTHLSATSGIRHHEYVQVQHFLVTKTMRHLSSLHNLLLHLREGAWWGLDLGLGEWDCHFHLPPQEVLLVKYRYLWIKQNILVALTIWLSFSHARCPLSLDYYQIIKIPYEANLWFWCIGNTISPSSSNPLQLVSS